MAASDTLGLVIAGAIGAGGAVTAQIISSVVTSRKDSKRFDWEREKQERDWDNQEKERFMDMKRELYSRYFKVCLDITIYIDTFETWNKFKTNIDMLPVPDINTLREVSANISLIAPAHVGAEVNDVLIVMLKGLSDSLRSKDTESAEDRHARTAYMSSRSIQMYQSMRKDLGLDNLSTGKAKKSLAFVLRIVTIGVSTKQGQLQ